MDRKRYNILYVDDEPSNLVVFENAFFPYYNIYSANSGPDALEVLKQKKIHLFITDHKMPGVTGIELLERIKPEYPDMVTMIITAYSDVEIILPAINKCNIYSYILKPWDVRELKITIENALAKYQLEKDKQQLLESLKQSNLDLENKVQERTREIQKKNQELEQLNQLKDRLFSVISHDLKQPILSFGVFIETIKKLNNGLSENQLEDFTDSLQFQLTEVKDLLDNLLNWSLLQMNGKEVELESFDINDELTKSINIYKMMASKKDIRIELNFDNPEQIVKGDKGMSNLVLRNLISNAIKFTNQQGIISCISKKENGLVTVEVKDTGVGFDEAAIQVILNTNKHITSRGTANEKGVGLGLQLCKEFLEKQGSELLIESNQGSGSTLRFQLPII